MTTTKGVRDTVAAALRVKLPTTYKVIPAPRTVDRISSRGVVVLIARERVERSTAALGAYTHTVAAWVLVAPANPDNADDALDDALDDVLDALRGHNLLHFEGAERGTYLDTFHGYKVTLSLTTT